MWDEFSVVIDSIFSCSIALTTSMKGDPSSATFLDDR